MLDLSLASDGDLAALALGGHPAAHRALLDRHRARVFRLARHHCGQDDAALDITQQAFIKAFAALDRYDQARPFGHWIARIALNACRDWGRRQALRSLFTMGAPIETVRDCPDPAILADQVAQDRQELARAMAAIAQLPARLKDVLVLRAIEGLSQAETASLLGITEKAVETRLRRAREKITTRLRG